MNTQRKKLIARNKIIVASFIILCIMTTVLFFIYKGEKILDLTKPQQQITYYKISELTKEEHVAVPQTIKVYRQQHMVAIVQEQENQCERNEEEIKKYE